MPTSTAVRVEFTGSARSVDVDAKRAGTSVRGYGRNVDRAGQSTRRFARRTREGSTALRGMGSVARTATRSLIGLTSVIGGGIGVQRLVRDATEFERAMTEVSSLIDPLPAQMGRLATGVQQVSASFGTSQVDNARALYNVISAGAATSTEEQIKLVDSINVLAQAGLVDAATASNIMTAALNSYNIAAGEAASVTDKLFGTVVVARSTLEQLSQRFGALAPIASAAGLSLDETLGAFAAVTRAGVEPARAMDGLRAAMANILRPSAQAAKLAKELGIEFNVTALAAQGLEQFLSNVVEATGGRVDLISEFFGAETGQVAVLALTNNLERYRQTLGFVENSAGLAGEASAKFADDAGRSLLRLQENARRISSEIGQDLLGAFQPSIDQLNVLLSSGLDPENAIDNFVDSLTGADQVLAGFAATAATLALGSTGGLIAAALFGRDTPAEARARLAEVGVTAEQVTSRIRGVAAELAAERESLAAYERRLQGAWAGCRWRWRCGDPRPHRSLAGRGEGPARTRRVPPGSRTRASGFGAVGGASGIQCGRGGGPSPGRARLPRTNRRSRASTGATSRMKPVCSKNSRWRVAKSTGRMPRHRSAAPRRTPTATSLPNSMSWNRRHWPQRTRRGN